MKKQKTKQLLLALILLFGANVALAQRTVTGTIIDGVTGEILPFVTVRVQGTTTGAMASDRGIFSITVPSAESVLTFSMIGYETLELPANVQEAMTVRLRPAATMLEDVVITGYQTMSRAKTAGAITTLNPSELMLSGFSTLDAMLQGQAPGMMVQSTSGEPGVTAQIRIRGNTTLTSNQAPLWVVDGVILEQAVPFEASDITSEDAEYLIGNAIAGLNPKDIETITVLRDVSATAIYGSRAANGVIVITTKKGASGPMRVQYDGNMTLRGRPSYRNFDRMNSQQRVQLSREIVQSGISYPASIMPFNPHTFEGAYYALMEKLITQEEFERRVSAMQTQNTDWFGELFRTSISQSHRIALSGGTDAVRYFFSTGYSDDRGGAIGSSSERFNVLSRINSTYKRLDIDAKIAYSTNKNLGYFDGLNPFDYAYTRTRTLPLYNEDGSRHRYMSNLARVTGQQTGGQPVYYNILDELENTGRRANVDRFESVLNLNVRLLPGLNYRSTVAYNISNSSTKSWATDRSNHIAAIRGYEHGFFGETHPSYMASELPYGGILTRSDANAINYTVRNALEYRQIFNKLHSIHVFGAMEVRSDRHTGSRITGFGWNPLYGEVFMPVYTESFINDYVQNGRLNPVATNRLTRVASFMSTLSYSYDDRYVFNTSIRSDGSNRFGSDPKYRWLPTWMVSGLWNISNEDFVRENMPWLNHAGLRASYGLQGNTHDHLTPNLITQYDKRHPRSGLDHYTIRYLPNPELRWEQTRSWNMGFDFAIFRSRLRGGVDIYNRLTTDLIMNRTIAASNGRTILFHNAGEMINKGIEGYLQYLVLNTREWNLRLSATFGRNTNEVLLGDSDIDLTDINQISLMLNGRLAIEGMPAGAVFSYEFAGLSPKNGFPLFVAKDGRKVHLGHPDLMNLVYSGSVFPSLYGGFNINIGYKRRLTLDLGFTYNWGNVKRLPSVYSEADRAIFDPLMNVSNLQIKRWRQPGDEKHTHIPALYDRSMIGIFQNNPEVNANADRGHTRFHTNYFYNNSSALVARADFLKFRSVRLSYQLPRNSITQNLNITDVRVNFQAVNLFTFADKVWAGIDPESANARIPNLPTFTFGVSVNF